VQRPVITDTSKLAFAACACPAVIVVLAAVCNDVLPQNRLRAAAANAAGSSGVAATAHGARFSAKSLKYINTVG
jgi:hypothetical protein